MKLFEQAMVELLGVEGDYSDNAADSGGKTRFGITEATARAHGYGGEMRALPLDVAKKIYRAEYWDALLLDEVGELSERIAMEIFDTAVNCGVVVAAEILQRSLNVLNRQQKDYPDVLVDGLLGGHTVGALQAYLARRKDQEGELVLLRVLNSLQGARYVRLAEAREKDEAFVFGWFKTRIAI